MKDQRLENVIDYVLHNENVDFFNHLEEMNLTEDERETLTLWGSDDIGTTHEVRRIMVKLAHENGGHIYASAICLSYGWDNRP